MQLDDQSAQARSRWNRAKRTDDISRYREGGEMEFRNSAGHDSEKARSSALLIVGLIYRGETHYDLRAHEIAPRSAQSISE